MSTDDPDGRDGGDEPRAKDLLTRPREELEQQMDPATLAQLSSWFEMPNLADVEETAAQADAAAGEDKEVAERRKRREAACAAADPALVRKIESYAEPRCLVMPDFELAPIIDETIVNVAVRAQLDRLSADEPVRDVSEYAQPGDVSEIVSRHNTPQAILRDLYRPVTEYVPRLESPFEEIPDLDPRREVREALREHHTVEWLEPTFVLGAVARAEAKAILRVPWPQHWEVVQQIKKAREEL